MLKHGSIIYIYIALCPRKPEGSLGWTAQDGHLDSHTAPELCGLNPQATSYISGERISGRWREIDAETVLRMRL